MGPQQSRLQTAVEHALAGATILTANTRIARRLRLEVERRAFESHSVCETPDVLPLEAWIARTWTDALLAGVVDHALLKANVAAALWEQIVATSAAGRALMSHHAAAQLANSAWQLLHSYRISRGRSSFSATAETKAFFEWSETFLARCRQEHWVDAAAALPKLTTLLARIPDLPKHILFCGFDQLTPAQQDLARAIEACGSKVDVFLPESPAKREHCSVVSFPDRKEELRSAARWARAKLAANPSAMLGVIVPELETHRNTIDTIFDEILHPEALVLPRKPSARLHDLSIGHNLAAYPILRTALQILRLTMAGLSATESSELLRSQYLLGAAEDADTRALLDYELRSRLRSSVTVRQLIAALGDCRISSPSLVKVLRTLESAQKKQPGLMSRSEFTVMARRLLASVGWPTSDSDGITLNSEEFQATTKWDQLLTSFGALDQVLPSSRAIELLGELERAAAETSFAPENAAAPIQIAGPLAVSGESFDALWFCGLTDEAWPQRGQPNPLIPFQLQKQAGAPFSSADRSLQDAKAVTARVLQSAEECVFSWPKREDDRELRPSPLLGLLPIGDVKKLSLAELHDWDQEQELAELQKIEDEQAPAVASQDLGKRRSTRLLEWQSSCPFRAFSLARLVADDTREPTLGANALDRGRIVDVALEHLWRNFLSLQNLESLPDEVVEAGIARAIAQALEEDFPKGDEPWLAKHREIERDRLNGLLHEWLDVERERHPFHNIATQEPVEVEIGGLQIRGRADRIEQTVDGGWVVIDYKTGSTKYTKSYWELPRPRDPQLMVYAVAQMMAGREVDGVAFASVRPGTCSFKGDAVRKDIFNAFRNHKRGEEFSSTLTKWQPGLEKLASDLLAGHAEVDPSFPLGNANSPCNRCHLKALCRVAEYKDPRYDDEEDAFGEE